MDYYGIIRYIRVFLLNGLFLVQVDVNKTKNVPWKNEDNKDFNFIVEKKITFDARKISICGTRYAVIKLIRFL